MGVRGITTSPSHALGSAHGNGTDPPSLGDDLLIEEAVAALGARMAAEDAMGGGLPEKVRLKAEGRGSGDGAEVLGELRRRQCE